MLCQQCHKRKATVHVTENIYGHVNEQYFCENCATELNKESSAFAFSVHDLLSNYFDQDLLSDVNTTIGKEKNCPQCGQTYSQYKKTGLLGCAKCYEVYRKALLPLIRRIQGSDQHVGKVPVKVERIQRFQKRAQQLQIALKEAIRKEEYEKAAEIRDQIRVLEHKVSLLKGDAK